MKECFPVGHRAMPHIFGIPGESLCMPSEALCRHEIESLHEFFVDWFTGQTPADTFDRIEGALAPDFEMVTPAGTRRDYGDVVDAIRDDYAAYEPGTFDIDIRNVTMRCDVGYHSLVRYEEWQDTPDGSTGRLSTVLFEDDPDAPGKVRWLDVHETWLDGPD